MSTEFDADRTPGYQNGVVMRSIDLPIPVGEEFAFLVYSTVNPENREHRVYQVNANPKQDTDVGVVNVLTVFLKHRIEDIKIDHELHQMLGETDEDSGNG